MNVDAALIHIASKLGTSILVCTTGFLVQSLLSISFIFSIAAGLCLQLTLGRNLLGIVDCHILPE